MISIPGSFYFAKLVMMSSASAKSAGRQISVPRSIHSFLDCPIQSQLQMQLRVHSFYVERNYMDGTNSF